LQYWKLAGHQLLVVVSEAAMAGLSTTNKSIDNEPVPRT
jgi:hypothetical protein